MYFFHVFLCFIFQICEAWHIHMGIMCWRSILPSEIWVCRTKFSEPMLILFQMWVIFDQHLVLLYKILNSYGTVLFLVSSYFFQTYYEMNSILFGQVIFVPVILVRCRQNLIADFLNIVKSLIEPKIRKRQNFDSGNFLAIMRGRSTKSNETQFCSVWSKIMPRLTNSKVESNSVSCDPTKFVKNAFNLNSWEAIPGRHNCRTEFVFAHVTTIRIV